jgi:hypothetical protein
MPDRLPLSFWVFWACAVLVASSGELGCSNAANGSGGADAEYSTDGGTGQPFDLCDAFTTVGSSCPAASPLLCFPMCDAGGCSCRESPRGPEWACVTDVSCLPPCAPIDDGCAPD